MVTKSWPATTITFPRSTTFSTRRPVSCFAPSRVQVAPPSVLRSRPVSALPLPKLLTSPMPAISTLWSATVGSNWRALIDAGPMFTSGVQLGLAAVALSVLKMPPFTVPTHITSWLVGCGRTTSTAPATGLFWATMPSTIPFCAGAGPWGMNCGAPNGTAPNVRSLALKLLPSVIRFETRKPGVMPAAIAALSTAACTWAISWAAVVLLVVSLLSMEALRVANALPLRSPPASPTRVSTWTPASAPLKVTE